MTPTGMNSATPASLNRSEQVKELGRRCHWRLRLAWERASWPEFLAVAVLGFGLGLMLWVNEPLHREARALQVQALRAAEANQTAVAEAAAASDARPAGDTGFVEGLLAFLPAPDVREQQMRTLHALAADSGVELGRVDYSHAGLEHLPARRMSMQLAVSAEYGDYRKFLRNLLVAMPNLVVDRVTMEKAPDRMPGTAGRLTVRLEASLFYRAHREGVAGGQAPKEGPP